MGIKFLPFIFLIAIFASSCKIQNLTTSLPPELPPGYISVSLSYPSSSPNSESKPTFVATGANGGIEAGDTVYLYLDSKCARTVGHAVASGTSVSIQSDELNIGSYTYYARSKNSAGVLGPCSGGQATYTYAYVLTATFTYDFVPIANGKLDYANVVKKPIRNARVEVKTDPEGVLLGSYNSSETGVVNHYLTVDQNIKFYVYAETTTPSIAVQDNTAKKAKYVAITPVQTVSSDKTYNFNFPSGWNGTNTSGGYAVKRFSAPFAILDSMYTITKKVLAARPSISLPALKVNWSIDNVATLGDFTKGFIGTTHYNSNDNQIYILGKDGVDTDEFDRHIIVHEWGHFFEKNLSRSDSIGGIHGAGDTKDMSLAFGEGWGNALSGIAFDPDTTYYDTCGSRQQTMCNMIVIKGGSDPTPGWFSEASITHILYSIYDNAATATDTVALGLGPILDVFTGSQKTTSSMTSIFSFITGLKLSNQSSITAIDTLVGSKNINYINDVFGSTETNFGVYGYAKPLYNPLTIGGGIVSTKLLGATLNDIDDTFNSFYNNRYFKFTASSFSSKVTISTNDTFVFQIYQQGSPLFVGDQFEQRTSDDSFGPFSYDFDTIPGKTYILKIYTEKSLLHFATYDSVKKRYSSPPVDLMVTVDSN
jgi:hypothetical protein